MSAAGKRVRQTSHTPIAPENDGHKFAAMNLPGSGQIRRGFVRGNWFLAGNPKTNRTGGPRAPRYCLDEVRVNHAMQNPIAQQCFEPGKILR
ncbi:MAG: hypothetical protein LBK41_01435 [Clostridiales bacterium]|nr:hypothetical protein [Clostridiales bacterium]